jgi:hypothetical protein
MIGENYYIYEVKSIGLSVRRGRKPQTLLEAARHNLREVQLERGLYSGNIDPARTHLNEVIKGPRRAHEVVDRANKLFAQAGIDQSKLRKDYNQASEHVFSLRPGQQERGFFEYIANRAIELFGADNVLSFVVHRDQAQPHAHMLVSPLSDGRYLGSKRHMRDPLNRLKSEFRKAAETIGFSPALDRRIKRQKLSERSAAIVAYLESGNDPLLFHPLWPVILFMINQHPAPLYDHLKRLPIGYGRPQSRIL